MMHQGRDRAATSWRPPRSQLYTNTGYLWFAVVAFALLGFAFWALVARLYSPEAVGRGGSAVTALVVLGQVSQLGLGYALIRFIPQSGQEAPLLLSRSLVAVTAASLLTSVLFLGILPFWSPDLQGLLWKNVGYAGGFIAFVTFVTVAEQLRFTFIAYRRGSFVLALNLLIGLLRLLVVTLLAGLGSAFGIVTAHGLAVLFTILLTALFLLPRCINRSRIPLALDVWQLALLVRFSLGNMASHVLTVLAWQLLPLLVIALAGAEAAGFFYVAWAVTGIILIMTQQLALSLFAEGSYNLPEFGSQARGALLVAVALGGLFALLVYFLGDMVLLLFGREYVEQASNQLKALATATPFAAVTSVYLTIERLRSRVVPLVAMSALVILVMVGAITLFMPRFGIIGAGYGVIAGYSVGALMSLPVLYPLMKRTHQLVGTDQNTTP